MDLRPTDQRDLFGDIDISDLDFEEIAQSSISWQPYWQCPIQDLDLAMNDPLYGDPTAGHSGAVIPSASSHGVNHIEAFQVGFHPSTASQALPFFTAPAILLPESVTMNDTFGINGARFIDGTNASFPLNVADEALSLWAPPQPVVGGHSAVFDPPNAMESNAGVISAAMMDAATTIMAPISLIAPNALDDVSLTTAAMELVADETFLEDQPVLEDETALEDQPMLEDRFEDQPMLEDWPMGSTHPGQPALQGGGTASCSRTAGPELREWESNKLAIETMYIHHNLTLEDVKARMVSRHNFRATTKMYKTQFKRWHWHKYRSGKAAPSSRRKDHWKQSCLRRPKERLRALLHENTATSLVDQALATLRNFMSVFLEREPRLKTFSKYGGWWNVRTTLSWTLTSGLQHLGRHYGDRQAGVLFLKRSFLELSNYVLEISFSRCYTLTIKALVDFLYYKREDLLLAYLRYLGRLSKGHEDKHPVHQIISHLYEVALVNNKQLVQYVCSAMGIVGDLLEKGLGSNNLDNLQQWADRAYGAQRLGFGPDREWTTQQIRSKYDILIREAAEAVRSGELSERRFIEIRMRSLDGEHCMDGPVNNRKFVGDLEDLRRSISARHRDPTLPMSSWEPWELRRYSECTVALINHFLGRGENRRAALDLLPDFMSLFEADLTMRAQTHFLGIVRRLASALREEGNNKQADELTCRSRAWTEKAGCSVSRLVDRMGALDIEGMPAELRT